MAAIVFMPKATMDKNDFPARNENEVRFPWKGLDM
jgi:hypothetical protein